MSKQACIYIEEVLWNTDAWLNSLIHDESLCTVPGQCTLNLAKSKFVNGLFKPHFDPSAESIEWAELIKAQMCRAEHEIFNEELVGLADYAIGPFWNH